MLRQNYLNPMWGLNASADPVRADIRTLQSFTVIGAQFIKSQARNSFFRISTSDILQILFI